MSVDVIICPGPPQNPPVNVDVIICTKDRPQGIRDMVAQVKAKIPHHWIIVVDSSSQLNLPASWFHAPDIAIAHTPNVKLGFARQTGLEISTTKLVAYIDDDLKIREPYLPVLQRELEKDPSIAAVSPNVIYGYKSDPVIYKIFMRGSPRTLKGHSGGAALMKREVVLALGGYNKDVHYGEDAELSIRMDQKGYQWLRCSDAVVLHSCTFQELLVRGWRNGVGCGDVFRRLPLNRIRWAAYLFGALLVTPFKYLWLARDPRAPIYWGLYRLLYLAGFLTELKK